MAGEKEGKIIQSVKRAIDILNCFDELSPELTLTQISTQVGLNKSTVHGILRTLCCSGYVRQNSDGKYLIGQQLLNKIRLQHGTQRSVLLDVARPYMEELCEYYKSSTNLFLVEQGQTVLLHREIPQNAAYYVIHPLFTDNPLYSTASGKLILANMPEKDLERYLAKTRLQPVSSFTIHDEDALHSNLEAIRNSGFSYENEERLEGISAVSVPIYNLDKELFGTLSVSGVSFHISKNYDALVCDLTQASHKIMQAVF